MNPHTNAYRWGDAYLDWNGGEVGQAVPLGGLGGGSPVDWTTSLAQGQNQPYVCMAGYGIADQNHFGLHYWMLDVDMDCEQAFDDGLGHRWFELKAFIAPSPGWEGNIAQNSTPAPPYPSINHMGLCGLVNVFVANFANRPGGLDPNFAQFSTPTYTYLTPVDERNASADVLNNTPCASPGVVVSATWRNRANLPLAASSSAPCKIAPRPHLGATLSRCARGQPACAAHRVTATTASDQAKLVTGSR